MNPAELVSLCSSSYRSIHSLLIALASDFLTEFGSTRLGVSSGGRSFKKKKKEFKLRRARYGDLFGVQVRFYDRSLRVSFNFKRCTLLKIVARDDDRDRDLGVAVGGGKKMLSISG